MRPSDRASALAAVAAAPKLTTEQVNQLRTLIAPTLRAVTHAHTTVQMEGK
jgi:hypothetical protein